MKKLFSIITVLVLAMSLCIGIAADEAQSKSEVVLVALLSDSVALSDPVDITENGEYTFTITDLNVDTAKDGLPTVYIKDVIRHTTDQISGYFAGAKATTLSFKINGKEVEVPQNRVGDTATFGEGYLDMCWIWNGCPLDLGGEVINEISVTVSVEMPDKENVAYLVVYDGQTAHISKVELAEDGKYTVALNGLSIDVTSGFCPTVYLKDSVKYTTGNDSGYFSKAEIKTVAFAVNGVELTTPQNPAGSTAQMGEYLDICWIWDGCNLNFAEAGIETITDISVDFELMPASEAEATEPAETEPVATEPEVTTTEETTTEATTTEATTTAEEPAVTEPAASEEIEETEPEAEKIPEDEEEAPADNAADGEESEFPLVPVLIGIAAIAIVAIIVIILIPTKKK